MFLLLNSSWLERNVGVRSTDRSFQRESTTKASTETGYKGNFYTDKVKGNASPHNTGCSCSVIIWD